MSIMGNEIIIGLLVLLLILQAVILIRMWRNACSEAKLNEMQKSAKDDRIKLKQDILTTMEAINANNGDAIVRLGEGTVNSISSLGHMLKQTQQQAAELQQQKADFNMKSMNVSMAHSLELMRQAQSADLQRFQDTLGVVADNLEALTKANEEKLEAIRISVSDGLQHIQENNDKKLEIIRETVEEKLQSTLEKRFAASFQIISRQMENVAQNLGEMQNIAKEVGGLKKVLSNVKLRGILGEVQLERIIADILSPEQYATNVITVPGSSNRVEFASRLPGDNDEIVYLPIDSKFPADTFNSLQAAKESGEKDAIDKAKKLLIDAVFKEAKDIDSKYLKPPYTTNFGIMFVPFESLYSTILELGILEELQKKHNVILAGPSNMAAILHAFQMGFRSIALQRRASEVAETLTAVKTEFVQFESIMRKMKRNLDLTSKNLDTLMGPRAKAINRKLRDVGTMELAVAEDLLDIPENTEELTDF